MGYTKFLARTLLALVYRLDAGIKINISILTTTISYLEKKGKCYLFDACVFVQGLRVPDATTYRSSGCRRRVKEK